MNPWWIPKIAKVVAIVILAGLVFGLVVMVLWNALVPELFRGPELSFWQALGLLILSHILLRGWGGRYYSSEWRHDRWRRRFESKVASMSPEEREKFREEWDRRCGRRTPAREADPSAQAT